MQNSGESEMSGTSKKSPKLTTSFWQLFLLTLSGATGMVSMVAEGPHEITYSGLAVAIVVLLWIIASSRNSNA